MRLPDHNDAAWLFKFAASYYGVHLGGIDVRSQGGCAHPQGAVEVDRVTVRRVSFFTNASISALDVKYMVLHELRHVMQVQLRHLSVNINVGVWLGSRHDLNLIDGANYFKLPWEVDANLFALRSPLFEGKHPDYFELRSAVDAALAEESAGRASLVIDKYSATTYKNWTPDKEGVI